MKKLLSGNTNDGLVSLNREFLKGSLRSRRPNSVDNKLLQTVSEENPPQTTRELIKSVQCKSHFDHKIFMNAITFQIKQ